MKNITLILTIMIFMCQNLALGVLMDYSTVRPPSHFNKPTEEFITRQGSEIKQEDILAGLRKTLELLENMEPGQITGLANKIRNMYHDLANAFNAVSGIMQLQGVVIPDDPDVNFYNTIRRLINEQFVEGHREIKEAMSARGNIKSAVRKFINACIEFETLLSNEKIKPLKSKFESQDYNDLVSKRDWIQTELVKIFLSGHAIETTVDINDQLDKVIRIELKDTSVAITRAYDPNKPEIIGDEGDFNRIVANLIRNAQESGTTEIIIKTSALNNEVKIIISDNGPGMPQDKVSAFNAGGSVSSSKGEDRGLGLDNVKTMVQSNKGEIKVTARYDHNNHGTIFTIVFPLKPVDLREIVPSNAIHQAIGSAL